MLTHRFPYPPNRGDRIRSYNLLKVLSRTHELTLACTSDEDVPVDEMDHVRGLAREVILRPLRRMQRLGHAAAGAVCGRSLTQGMFHSPSLASAVLERQCSQPFDVVLVFCSSMFPYVDRPEFASSRIVVDLVDVDSEKWLQLSRESAYHKRWLYRFEYGRVRQLERRIADRADAVVLVSDREAELFQRAVSPNVTATGVSNGVDTEYFTPAIVKSRQPSHELVGDHQPLKEDWVRLVFTGVLDYRPNVDGMVWFCHEVLPRLRESFDVRLNIVGRRPNRTVLMLSELAGVDVIGEVPDVRPYLHAADIAISPLKLARGIQNKVLEAMATGLPVVLTSQSAEGIDAEPGTHLIIADSVDEWIQAISRLNNEASYRQSVATAARQLVVDQYSWPARLRKLTDLLEPEVATIQ